MIFIQNILVLFVFALLIYLILRTYRRSAFRNELATGFARPLPRFSLYLLGFYLLVAFLDLLYISSAPGDTLLQWMIHWIPEEESYSMPWAFTDLQGETLNGWHLLGTNINGKDVLGLVLSGARTAIILGPGSSILALGLGTLLGLLSGYLGGWVDDLVQWIYTTVASVPWFLFVISFIMVFGRDLIWIAMAIGLTAWVEPARLIRAETMQIRNLSYVRSARAAGFSTFSILMRQVLPNVSYIIVITFALTTSQVILAESVLTFIGIGVEPGTASWGILLTESNRELLRSPPVWWIFAATTLLGILPPVLGLNVIADTIRDATGFSILAKKDD
ncbi:MAG TPA: hypothetical protein DEA96_13370 [Leptospiraceae bacterium]|nr:hypothetical protein [Spirochaetaceae bacterium]HBS05952.1 hypothetical protein [Leptospiraceae bacterium]|tara:strand:- start:24952 stop:25950 length:999 start_codon:yes stop_codon:yes gene_type:complete